jgi:hypothetical protein
LPLARHLLLLLWILNEAQNPAGQIRCYSLADPAKAASTPATHSAERVAIHFSNAAVSCPGPSWCLVERMIEQCPDSQVGSVKGAKLDVVGVNCPEAPYRSPDVADKAGGAAHRGEGRFGACCSH